MKTPLITGIHHITAMASDPQKNLDFYAGLLGLRLVKKTVNFDAPDVYHLYYGDETGLPGSILTFFPFGASPYRGRQGNGQAATTSFSIPMGALDYWMQRFERYGIAYKQPQSRFDEAVIYFEDPDGLGLELIANTIDTRQPFTYGHIPAEYAIRGFWGTELWEKTYERTEGLLTQQMDYQFVGESGVRRRYAPQGGAQAGKYVDVLWDSVQHHGVGGIGTVHHIAFDTPSDESQLEVRETLLSAGFMPTHVLDRQYFHSIYFHEPGGVLFEVATTPPGFIRDEAVADLGTALKLPNWQEPNRASIEAGLQPISLEKALAQYPQLKKQTMSVHKIENTVYTGTSRAAAQRVMILLHGRGASAQSILPLVDALDLKDFAVIAPNATDGTWYPYSFMAPIAQNEPYLSSALDLVKAICDQLLANGLSTRQLYFAGFSQGACLTAEFIGRNAAAYGGAFIFTGGLIGEQIEPARYQGNFEGTPIFLGSADPDFHVPVERVYATGNIFRDLGATVTEKIYPGMGHTIVDDEIQIATGMIHQK